MSNQIVNNNPSVVAEIKKELKVKFPNTSFSIKTHSLFKSNSVKVSWVDGPTLSEVDATISKYQYGRYDGIEGVYITDNIRSDIPQSKYVLPDRRMSPSRRKSIKEALTKRFGININNHKAVFSMFGKWPEHIIWQEFSGISYK